MCACARIRAGARACACACVHVALLIQHATYCDVICGPSCFTTFFYIIINGAISGEKLLKINYVF